MGRVLSRIERILTSLSIAAVFLMVCLTTADTIGRYVLNMPIQAANEVTAKYLMVVAVFFGLSYGYHSGSNIRVTFLVRHFSGRTKLVLEYIVQLLSVVIVLLLVVSAVALASRNLHQGLLDAPSVPVGPAYVVAPVGLCLLALWLIYDVRQVRKGKSGLLTEEEEDVTTSTT